MRSCLNESSARWYWDHFLQRKTLILRSLSKKSPNWKPSLQNYFKEKQWNFHVIIICTMHGHSKNISMINTPLMNILKKNDPSCVVAKKVSLHCCLSQFRRNKIVVILQWYWIRVPISVQKEKVNTKFFHYTLNCFGVFQANVSFLYPRKHQKTFGIFMFSEGMEMKHWLEMG